MSGLPKDWKTLGSKVFLGIISTKFFGVHSCMPKLGQICLGAKADLDQVVEIKTWRAHPRQLLQLIWNILRLRISVTWVQIPMGAIFLLYFTLPLKITEALSCEVPRNSAGFSSSDLQIHWQIYKLVFTHSSLVFTSYCEMQILSSI